MSGSATSIFLLHFYTGGVVHRCNCWEIGAPFKSRFSAPFYCPSVGSPSVMADLVAGSISSSPPLQVAGGEEEQPKRGRRCCWKKEDRQLPSSSFISTPAVSSTAATVGRSARLSSLGFLLPSTVLRLVLLLSWPIWWLGVFLLLLRFRWLAVKRNNRKGGAAAAGRRRWVCGEDGNRGREREISPMLSGLF
ncbi:hypothetical protein NC652_008202 [Populus alba x Populus x berolinensis]|nr:hypothetical protein NC652_008202 [Populus alba x Populus x berolinensis]